MRFGNVWLVYFACTLLTACGTKPIKLSDKHIQQEQGGEINQAANIPQPVKRTIPLPPPTATPKAETYSVVVTNVPAQEILFALARDAKINLDIHAGIQGAVTLNAIDQTLPQILSRIAKQVDMRYELENGNLSVMPDKPFLRTYKIDFLNMSRTVSSAITTSTAVGGGIASGGASGSQSAGKSVGTSGGAGGNTASTSVNSNTKNDLMESLISNVSDMLKEEDKLIVRESDEFSFEHNARAEGTGHVSTGNTLGKKTTHKDGTTDISEPGDSASGSGNQSAQSQGKITEKLGFLKEAVYVFANRETGVLLVRATTRQHEKVQEFIDMVMNTAKRQVLIEATIVEVRLSDNYKQGINWSQLRLGSKGLQLTQAGTAGLPSTNPLNIFTLDYANPTSIIGNLSAQISLLESFGKVKVLSSPKLSVMNNQTATLKVADEKVYFTIQAVTTDSTVGGPGRTTYSTTPTSISVGFLMNVTPQISDSDTVTINIRPTITRIISFVNDPNPSLPAGVVNRVPEIQTREMESIIKINSGQTAVMGGLMQDEVDNLTDAIPGLSNMPVMGGLFKNRNDTTTKTELVIFLRPVVIKDASVNGDYSAFRDNLPDVDFFKPTPDKSSSSNKP